MLKNLFSINDIVELFRNLMKFKGWIMSIFTVSGGIGSLAFFNSKLGVAVTCGVLFAIFCFIALFVVISLKKSNEKNGKKEPETRNSINLTREDVEYLLGGKYLDDETFFYDESKISKVGSKNAKGQKVGFLLSPSYKVPATLHAPKNSKATVRFELHSYDSRLEDSGFVIYIYDAGKKERMLTGSINEFEISLDESSSFRFIAMHKKIGDSTGSEVNNVSLLVQLISWRK